MHRLIVLFQIGRFSEEARSSGGVQVRGATAFSHCDYLDVVN